MKTKEDAVKQIKSLIVEEPQSAIVKQLITKMIEKAAEVEMITLDINKAAKATALSNRPQILKVNQMEGDIFRQFGFTEFLYNTESGKEHISYSTFKGEMNTVDWALYYNGEKKYGEFNSIKMIIGDNNCCKQIDGTLPVTNKACLGIVLDNEGKLKYYSTGFGCNIINRKRFINEQSFEELLSNKQVEKDYSSLGMMKKIQEAFAKSRKSKDNESRPM